MNSSKASVIATNITVTLQEFINLWERRDFAEESGTDSPTRDEVAYCIFENTGAFERYSSGEPAERLLKEVKEFLHAEREELAPAALSYMEGIDFGPTLEHFIERFDTLSEDAAAEESIEIILSRDEAQMALQCLRALAHGDDDPPDSLQRRAAIARSWHRADEYWRSHIECFFGAIPWMKGMLTRFDIKSLDRNAFWWWFMIPETFDRLVKTTETRNLGELLLAKPRLPEREWKLFLYGRGDLIGEDLAEVEDYLEVNPDERLLLGDKPGGKTIPYHEFHHRRHERLRKSKSPIVSNKFSVAAAVNDKYDEFADLTELFKDVEVWIEGTSVFFTPRLMQRGNGWYLRFHFFNKDGTESKFFNGGEVRLAWTKIPIVNSEAETLCSETSLLESWPKNIAIRDAKGREYQSFNVEEPSEP